MRIYIYCNYSRASTPTQKKSIQNAKKPGGGKRAKIMLSLAEKAEVKKDFFSVLTKIFLLTRTGKKCVEKQKPEEGSERSKVWKWKLCYE